MTYQKCKMERRRREEEKMEKEWSNPVSAKFGDSRDGRRDPKLRGAHRRAGTNCRPFNY